MKIALIVFMFITYSILSLGFVMYIADKDFEKNYNKLYQNCNLIMENIGLWFLGLLPFILTVLTYIFICE